MVEPQPSKLMTRVRFPFPAPASSILFSFHCVDTGLLVMLLPSNPCRCPCGSVVEHSLGKGEVTRSIRVMGTTCFILLVCTDTLPERRNGKKQI